MKTLYSQVTNFGCHYSCPYCIVKNNDIEVPETTIKGLSNLKQTLIGYGCNIVSISGGCDPLHNYEEHKDWYEELSLILESMGIPMEIHTSYIENDFPTNECKRVVYYLHDSRQLLQIRRKGNEIVKAIFVLTRDITYNEVLSNTSYVEESRDIDELIFVPKMGKDKENWCYIQQCDYNLYYAENKVYTKYSDFRKGDK